MAVTQNSYIGNGSTTTYAFTFPYLKSADIKAQIDATDTTAFTLPTATTLQFNTAPASGAKIKIYRATDDESLTATFYAGSSLKSEDLNDNFTQNLYTTQEVNARYLSNLGGTMVGDLTLGEDAVITFEGATDDAYETTLTVADPTADRTLTLPDATGTLIVSGSTGTVTGTTIANTTITAANIANGTITGTQIANDTVTATQIAANAVGASELANDAVDTAAIATGAVTSAKIADGTIVTADIADDAITAAKIADNAIGAAAITADAVGTSELADNSVASANIINGSILNEDINDSAGIVGTKLANNTITATQIAANTITSAELAANAVSTTVIIGDAITSAEIADNAVNSEHYVDGSIDHVHLSNDCIDGDNIQDSVINSEHYADGSIDREHLAADIVDGTKIADNAIGSEHIAANAVTTSEIADAELTTLAGMQSATASILAAGTNLTATLAEINSVVDGKAPQTTITDDDTKYPTSGAVVDYVAAQIAPIGGLEVIADEDNFPSTQPASGVVISISNCDGIVVNGSGVCTTARTAGNGSDNITINGFPASLQSKTLTGELGLMVSSTGSSQTYNYHKLLAKEADVEQLSQDIQDFTNRYRVGGSNPTSSLDAGDLFFNTGTNKMLVYNATDSSWDEVQSVGNFYINTISSYSGTGGNSATFNGTAYRFVLSNAPTTAQQLIVSINGVVQKPNAGTSQPGEGFAIDGSSIIFSSAPATSSDYFIITAGSTVNVGTPSDNTVDTDIIQNLAVTTAKIANDAVTGDKLSNNLDIPDNNKIRFGTGNDLEIYHDGSNSYIDDAGTGNLYLRGSASIEFRKAGGTEKMLYAEPDAQVELYYDNAKKLETTSVGASVTGNLGIDTATPAAALDFGVTSVNENVIHLRKNSNSIIGLGVSSGYGVKAFAPHDITSTDAIFETGTIGSDGSTYTQEGIQVLNNGNLIVNSGDVILADSKKLKLGASDDLQIEHNGTDSEITGSTGSLTIKNANNLNLYTATNEEAIVAVANGAVSLYYNAVKKLETQSGGVRVYGDLENHNDDFVAKDDCKFLAGNSGDLAIYHNGTDNFIHANDGDLNIGCETGHKVVIQNGSAGNHLAEFNYAGAVELFHNGNIKLTTITEGVRVDGEYILVYADEGTSAGIQFHADQGDDAGDRWRINANQDDNDLTFSNDTSSHGSFIDRLTLKKDGKLEAKSAGTTLLVHCDTTNDNDGAQFRHMRGGLSGYAGKMISFRGNDDTEEGNITIGTSATAYNTSSDYRLKENQVAISNGITRIKQLKPYRFNFKKDKDTTVDGFFAHEVSSIVSNAVFGEKDGVDDNGDPKYQSIDHSKLVPLLTAALQEAITEIETLKTKVTALEAA